jgi:hypothetical protein
MKPLPPPAIPGETEAERMDNAVRKLLTVSKEDYQKEEKRLKRVRERKKRAKARRDAADPRPVTASR